jgi:hypothetical protein
MIRNLVSVLFVLSLPAAVSGAEMAKQQVQSTHTESVKLAPGAIIRVNNSFGDVKVEGWDQPDIEITVLKSTTDYFATGDRKAAAERLERVKVVTEKRSENELVISTTPAAGKFPLQLPSARTGMTVECTIHAPRDTRLAIHHGVGFVLVSDMAAEIEATASRGDIVLMLREGSAYTFDAKSKFGTVISDFDGTPRVRLYRMGEQYATTNPPPAHKIYLRAGFGGITIEAVPPDAFATGAK